MSSQPTLSFLDYAKQSRVVVGGEDFWDDLARRVHDGKLIPVISHSLRDEPLLAMFQSDADGLDQLIAANWAEDIGYPLAERSDLARVAQYHQVTSEAGAEKAKRDYLDFVIRALLGWAKANDPAKAALIQELNLEHEPDLLLADVLVKLGYPAYPAGQEDPLRLLARLPLPVYITTSFYDSLERYLEAENKQPRCEVCTWSGQRAKVDAAYQPDPGYEPTVARPLVFHLLGLERFPDTVVLSVDDYLNFLVKIFRDEAEAKTSQPAGDPPAIPPRLWAWMTELPLLLLGYRLQSWDFQVVYRVITAKATTYNRDAGVVIQVAPDKRRGVTDEEAARRYLTSYFSHDAKFRVQWGRPEEFITRLYEAYQRRS